MQNLSNQTNQNFFIGVVSLEHVKIGVQNNFCQFCHGKITPLKQLKQNDWIIYYSPKLSMESTTIIQSFTAIGQILDATPYQVDMGNGFKPFRLNVKYFNCKEVKLKPLLNKLPFIKNKNSYGMLFRRGFFKLDQASFEIIATEMLGSNPLEKITI